MEYLTPVDNYLVVLPSLKGVTFIDIESCHGYINRYYEEKLALKGMENTYADYDMYEEKAREDIMRVVGVEEGEAKIYDLENFIEVVQSSSLFQEEKEEIIRKVIERNSKIDIGKYDLESILLDTKRVI